MTKEHGKVVITTKVEVIGRVFGTMALAEIANGGRHARTDGDVPTVTTSPLKPGR